MGLQKAKNLLNVTKKTRTRKATKIQDFQRMRKTRKNAAITIQTATRTRKAKNELKKLRNTQTRKITSEILDDLIDDATKKGINATTSETEGQIKEEIIRLMINEKLESKYDIIDKLQKDIKNYEKEIEEKEIKLEEFDESDDEWNKIDTVIRNYENEIENKEEIFNIKELVLDKIDELKQLNKDERINEVFETFREDVKDKILSIKSSTSKKFQIK